MSQRVVMRSSRVETSTTVYQFARKGEKMRARSLLAVCEMLAIRQNQRLGWNRKSSGCYSRCRISDHLLPVDRCQREMFDEDKKEMRGREIVQRRKGREREKADRTSVCWETESEKKFFIVNSVGRRLFTYSPTIHKEQQPWKWC